MPYSRFLQIWLVVFIWISITACGMHRSTNSGYLKTGQINSASRDKILTVIEEGDLEALRAALDAGLDPNFHLENGRTLLIHATVQNRLRLVKLLLIRGADRTLKGEDGMTALDQAVDSGNTRAQILLDPDRQAAAQGALMDAIRKKRNLKVNNLLEEGTDPNFVDGELQGESALTYALHVSSELVMETLTSWHDPLGLTDTDVNLVNASGETPLKIAKELKITPIIQLLESLGAKE